MTEGKSLFYISSSLFYCVVIYCYPTTTLNIFPHFNVHYHNDKKIYTDTQCATQINVGTGQSQMPLCEDVFNC